MVPQFTRTLLAVAISSALAIALGQAPQGQPAQSGPQWKDRAEYDMAQQIMQTQDGQKKLAMLDQWTQKYPNTEMNVLRMVQYLDAYRLLNQRDKMMETARKILAADPKNLTALYWTAVVVPMGQLSPQDTEFGAQAARSLAENLEDLKPAGLADADWQKTKESMKLKAVGHRALGFIALQNKDYPAAEKQVRENLTSNPADAEAAFWLGSAILGQKQPERQSEALFYFARAAAYDGPGAVDPARRKQLLDYVTKAYTQYHGEDPQGLQQLLSLARQNPAPPADFKILSDVDVKEQKIKQVAAQDPSLGFWLKLKDALHADPAYFDQGMKGALIPPETEKPLRGTVISATPAAKPKQVVVGIQDANTPEVTINVVDEALPGPAAPGTVIHFRGVATQLQKEPFMVTFDSERKQIEGWPAPERKTPPRKGGAKTKK